ncbi:MAG: amidohydrolase family protein [Gemmatimonadetes bacterium]|nr:amidohydrolase family protein [Gemmatimonadota bacterium]
MLLALVVVCGCAEDRQPADLLLVNGVVWTGAADGTPGAVAIRDGRIILAGSAREARRYRGPRTREIDLAGRLVVPGFIDSHTHFMDGGFQLASVDLRDAATPAEFTRRIAAFARGLPAGRWITGGNWDHELWPGAPLPRREWIDSVAGDHPVSVSRLDGHMAVVNTVALRLAGITAATPDPPGGTIVRDPATGVPTGVLKDEAMWLVGRHIPAPSAAERDEALQRAQAHALSHGVTMIEDMGSWADLETYRRARSRDSLRVRVYAFVPVATWKQLAAFVKEHGRGDDRLRWGGVKGFVDGSLGSTTAWFHQPYQDAPETSGLMVTDTAELRAQIQAADAAGLQVVVHAIGDRANDWLLDAFADAAAANGDRDRRFRIEHAQHLTAAAIPRFATQQVIASMQPYHAADDGRWAEKRVGPERIRTTYAFRSLLDAHARLAFGSDWTVAPLNPILGLHAAVTRQTIDGANPDGWVPEQKIPLDAALRAYTADGAYAAFLEDRLGKLEPGMLADLVVLSRNLLTLEPAAIRTASVDYTIVAGDVVYQRADR